MSFFTKFFGGKKEETMTTGEAIQQLRDTENLLIKKQEVLEKKIEQELDLARKNGTKNKRGTQNDLVCGVDNALNALQKFFFFFEQTFSLLAQRN